MPLDSLSYTAAARIRALVCPLGRIRRSRYHSFIARLQTANVVRLGDVTPDSRPSRTTFSPQGFPDGQVVYDLLTSYDREHEPLELFEFHRRTFLVIALADHAEENSSELLSGQLEELRFSYPNALHHVCLIFDAPPESEPTKTSLPKNAHTGYPIFISIPSKRESRVTSMHTVMCDITAAVLSELSALAKTLQTLPNIDSPLSVEAQSQGTNKNNRMSVPSGGGGATSGVSSLASKRMTITGFGSSTVSERTRNKGKGRVQIVVAELYLLAGRVPDAMKEFIEGAEVAKTYNDHLWHGKALECIGVCMVILAYLKHNFQIPHLPYPNSEAKPKSSPANSKPGTPAPAGSANGLENSATPQQILDLLPELLNTILNLYIRSANFPGESIPPVCYSEAVLRHCKALAAAYLANGMNEKALENIVVGTPIPTNGPKRNVPSRMEISTVVMRAYPQPIEAMTVLEVTRVLSGIASIYGCIGMRRRKALISRELLKILIPGLIQARVVGAAEVGVHPAAGLSMLSGGVGGGSPLDLAEGDVETGIMDFLEDICRSYGIYADVRDGSENKLQDEQKPKVEERPMSSGGEFLQTAAATMQVIAEQEIRSFGWPSLKIHVLRNCTALCEALPDFQGVLKFTAQLLRTADMELTREEQLRLSTTIQRTVGAARKLGLSSVEADYWDQFLLRDVTLVEHPTWRPPTAHSKDELLETDSDDPEIPLVSQSATNPFIYNPFSEKQESMATEKHLVKGEAAEFKVTLQNPFEFDIEVESVTLDVVGVEVDLQRVGVSIAPFRTFLVSAFVTPKGTGEVRVTGCKIKVFGCRERSFPIFPDGLDPREREIKTKRFGLLATQPKSERPVSQISTTQRLSMRAPPVLHPIPKTLSLTVVDSQPLLVVRKTSLSQNAIMVLEGERKAFQITLENLADVDVDLLMFSFTDSTTGRIQQALAEKTNSPAEMYELELMLSKKRAMKWLRPQWNGNDQLDGASSSRVKDASEGGRGQQNSPSSTVSATRPQASRNPSDGPARRRVYVGAHGTATFEVEVLGKPGLTGGTVEIDYGHLGQPLSLYADEKFYTRRVNYPITATVNASIELARVDFVPFSADLDISTSTAMSSTAFGLDSQFRKLFAGGGIKSNPSDYCLMLLDLRNAWPQPLRVQLTVTDPSASPSTPKVESEFTAEDVLQAGHTSRVILPIRRIFLNNASMPIPSATQTARQFVVSSTKISLEAERQSREAFWFREALLHSLRGTWSELQTHRAGDIELRGIRLSPRMVETLRVDDVGIELGVINPPSPPSGTPEVVARQLARKRWLVRTDEFCVMTTTLTNRSDRIIRPIMRLLPALRNQPPAIALDLSRRFAVNGLLQRPLQPLAPGERRTVETGFVCLAMGEYEISASVEEVLVRSKVRRPEEEKKAEEEKEKEKEKTKEKAKAKKEGKQETAEEKKEEKEKEKAKESDLADVLKGAAPSGGRRVYVCREVLVIVGRDMDITKVDIEAEGRIDDIEERLDGTVEVKRKWPVKEEEPAKEKELEKTEVSQKEEEPVEEKEPAKEEKPEELEEKAESEEKAKSEENPEVEAKPVEEVEESEPAKEKEKEPEKGKELEELGKPEEEKEPEPGLAKEKEPEPEPEPEKEKGPEKDEGLYQEPKEELEDKPESGEKQPEPEKEKEPEPVPEKEKPEEALEETSTEEASKPEEKAEVILEKASGGAPEEKPESEEKEAESEEKEAESEEKPEKEPVADTEINLDSEDETEKPEKAP